MFLGVYRRGQKKVREGPILEKLLIVCRAYKT